MALHARLALSDNAIYAICVTPSVIPGDAQLALSDNANYAICVTPSIIPGDAQFALSSNSNYAICVTPSVLPGDALLALSDILVDMNRPLEELCPDESTATMHSLMWYHTLLLKTAGPAVQVAMSGL